MEKPAVEGATEASLLAPVLGVAALENGAGDDDGAGDCIPDADAGADDGVIGKPEARSDSPLPRGEGKGCEPPLGS